MTSSQVLPSIPSFQDYLYQPVASDELMDQPLPCFLEFVASHEEIVYFITNLQKVVPRMKYDTLIYTNFSQLVLSGEPYNHFSLAK